MFRRFITEQERKGMSIRQIAEELGKFAEDYLSLQDYLCSPQVYPLNNRFEVYLDCKGFRTQIFIAEVKESKEGVIIENEDGIVRAGRNIYLDDILEDFPLVLS